MIRQHHRHHLVSFREESLLSSVIVVLHTLRDCFRIALLCACACVLLKHTYDDVYQSWTMWFGRSDRWFFIALTLVVHEGLYYGFNGLLLAFSHLNILQRYRIERLPNQEPSTALIKKTLVQSAIGHWIVQPLSLFVLFPLFVSCGMSVPTYLPSFWTSLLQLAGSVLINDCLFYWGHRLLHHPFLYKRFHKQHHEYKGTIGFSAEYATPLEQFLSNQLPAVVGPILFGMSSLQWGVYLFWRLWRTYEVHSGYDFSSSLPGKIGFFHGHGARYHDYHHSHNLGTYGGPANAFWDYFFNTQDHFAKHEEKNENPSYHSLFLF
eukprot:m.14813 g.14813  ORF g.14813 m.14813 type:complete len:321 (+) comp4375_c0_seq1:38-1000(+)